MNPLYAQVVTDNYLMNAERVSIELTKLDVTRGHRCRNCFLGLPSSPGPTAVALADRRRLRLPLSPGLPLSLWPTAVVWAYRSRLGLPSSSEPNAVHWTHRRSLDLPLSPGPTVAPWTYLAWSYCCPLDLLVQLLCRLYLPLSPGPTAVAWTYRRRRDLRPSPGPTAIAWTYRRLLNLPPSPGRVLLSDGLTAVAWTNRRTSPWPTAVELAYRHRPSLSLSPWTYYWSYYVA